MPSSLLLSFYRVLQSLLHGRGLLRNPVARHLHHWLVRNVLRKMRPGVFQVNGFPFYLDARNLDFGMQTQSDPELLAYIRSILRPGDMVLDIGANIGVITIPCAHLVGPHGRVFAFEPDHINCKALRRNLELNELSNVQLVEKAVSSSEGVAVLTLSATNPGGHSLLPVPSDSPLYPDRSEHATVEVPTVTVDAFLAAQSPGPVAFAKIDVEGWEVAVLEGMRDCLRANAGIRVVMEYVPALLMRAQIPIEKPLEYMRALGFEFFLVGAPPTPISFEALLALREKPWEGVNILCLRAQARDIARH